MPGDRVRHGPTHRGLPYATDSCRVSSEMKRTIYSTQRAGVLCGFRSSFALGPTAAVPGRCSPRNRSSESTSATRSTPSIRGGEPGSGKPPGSPSHPRCARRPPWSGVPGRPPTIAVVTPDILSVARRAAFQASEVCLAVLASAPGTPEAMAKVGKEPVTIADYGSQAVILAEVVGRPSPSHAVIAEEGSGTAARRGRRGGRPAHRRDRRRVPSAGPPPSRRSPGWIDHNGGAFAVHLGDRPHRRHQGIPAPRAVRRGDRPAA